MGGTGEKMEEVDADDVSAGCSKVTRCERPTGRFYISTGRGRLLAGVQAHWAGARGWRQGGKE